jgi:hypothetical protein
MVMVLAQVVYLNGLEGVYSDSYMLPIPFPSYAYCGLMKSRKFNFMTSK